MIRFFLGLVIAVILPLPSRLAAAVIVNLDPATANYSGGVVDDGSVTGSQSGIPLPTASLGLSWNIEFTPAAGDLTGTVLLVEMGGNANGTGLFLISGVPTFASKQAGTASRIPESPLPDLDFADQPGGPDSAGVVAAQSSFGALAAGQTYSVALTWDNANKFQLAVETAGVLISNLFTTVGTPGSWTGNGSLSVGTFSNPQFVGGLAGWNSVVSAPWDVTDAKNFAGTIHRALYWNQWANLAAPTNLGPWQFVLSATASSQIPGWEVSKVIDGDNNSTWSSTGHGTESNATEWVAVDYGQTFPMTGASISPRPGGGCWPVDYRIEYSTNGTTWAIVPGLSFTNQSPPSGMLTLTFSNAVIARALRLYATKLGNDGFNCYLQLGEFRALGAEPWAYPSELRGKKVINAAQYSTLNLYDSTAPTPKFLADNPDYLANHPFDGLSVPILLDRQWLTNQGLFEAEYALQDIVMTKLPIPWSQVSSAVADLKRVNWGHVTDNFLWYRVSDNSAGGDNDTRYAVNPASSNDWAIVAQNAALCARVCREAGLKGFMMDTEQYTTYASGELYPFGLGTTNVWRERGRQWIEAIQSEFPDITIIFFFSWGPESEPGGWPGYPNLKHFMNGVLAGVQAPARLIHGWESTFWWGGQAYRGGDPNDPNSYEHFPGDRTAYAGARDDIKNVWRNLSDNPAKYDQFVEAGMAAYVDSDPFNLWPGWPSGYLTDWPWSNLPYTLAYSDGYVWVWAAHTHYSASKSVVNPFLASIANRTFNTGQEQASTFTETFPSDPLGRGWYFDFDMLNIGRRLDGGPLFPFLPPMSLDSVPYRWDVTNHAVRVQGTWRTGDFGEKVGTTSWQRRRYVRPIQPLTRTNSFHAEFDFKVDNFGSDPANPILIGLFNSDSLVTTQAIRLRIDSATQASVTVVGLGVPWISNLTLSNALGTAANYRIRFRHHGSSGVFESVLTDLGSGNTVAYLDGTVPATVGAFSLDEAGIAQWDADFTATPPAQAHQFLLRRAALFPPAAVLSFISAPPLTGSGLLFALQGLPGQTYQIESSTNLVNWSVLGSVTASNTPVPFLDAAATNHARRFYRAVTNP